MTSAALVLFMDAAGLALFYGGLMRRKNVLSVMAAVPPPRGAGDDSVVGRGLQLGVPPAAANFSAAWTSPS